MRGVAVPPVWQYGSSSVSLREERNWCVGAVFHFLEDIGYRAFGVVYHLDLGDPCPTHPQSLDQHRVDRAIHEHVNMESATLLTFEDIDVREI